MRNGPLALASLVTLAGLLTVGCGTTSPAAGAAYGTTPAAAAAAAAGTPMTATATILTVHQTKVGYVLATATGRTVYWYADDVRGSGKSACTGGCASAWPAVVGTPVAAAGVRLSGKLGSITRPGGVVQATYNGYPLYTYAADTSAGQTLGNGIGGVWHVITGAELSPSAASAASASARDQPSASAAATSSP